MIRADELASYEWLSIPMWVFDKRQLGITWANAAALAFWDAPSLPALQERDFADISNTTRLRLETIHRRALQGETVEEQWTLYPRGRPKQIVLKSNVVEAIDGTTDGILFCAAYLHAVPDAQLRGVQVLHYTSTVVALHSMDGAVLYRNPAAVAAWDGLPDTAGLGPFAGTFANPADACRIFETIASGGRVISEFNMLTSKGERIFELDCRPITDPVDAQLVLGISGRDVTEYRHVENERNTLREEQLRQARAAVTAAQEADEEKRRLIAYGNNAIEEERQRIAGEIHDSLNASLVSVRLLASSIASKARDEGQDEVEGIARRISDTMQELYGSVREIVKQLRPEVLDALGLKGAVEAMVRTFDEAASDCTFTLAADRNFPVLRGQRAIAAYRAVQEALSNVVKHADATRVTVSLGRDPADGPVRITVKDNGKGFDPGVRGDGGLGLIGMRERVAAVDGRMCIESAAGSGTTITLWLNIE